MINALRSMNVYEVLLLILVLSQATTSDAKPSNQQCVASSCGDIRNISYPFRLQSDPKGCGDSSYELTCEDNHTVLYVVDDRFYVKSINYSAEQITLVNDGLQKGNCSSLPRHSWTQDDYERAMSPIYPQLLYSLVIVNCSKSVSSPFYIDASPCIEGSYFSTSPSWRLYALGDPGAADVRDFCTISAWAWTSQVLHYDDVTSSSYNYEQIHDIMADGFVASFYVSPPTKKTFNCHFGSWAFSRLAHYFRRLYDCSYSSRYSPCSGEYSCLPRCSPYNRDSGYSRSTLPDYLDYHGAICRWEEASGVGSDISSWTYDGFIPLLVLFYIGKFLIGAPFVMIFLLYKYRRRHLAMDKNIEDFLQANNNFMPIRYSYSNIKKITRNFKHKLGEGGYGYVYKGTLRSGNEVAIKILKSKAHGQDFINEVITIGRIHHVNIVQLIGFCFEGTKQALVYDLMSNGSLDKHIFTKEGDELLDYGKIYEIALGVARGIEYLHRGCDMQILHFDIKPHNILLDKNFTPKVSDFGLAKLYPTNHNIISLTAARGTLGYMAPELYYKDIGGVSYKADVYSFGMLLMEMAGRRKNINANAERSSQIYFPLWVYDQVDEGKSVEMGEVVEEERNVIKKMIIVAFWCIQLNPDHRPSMRKVLEMLERDIGKIQMPPRPLIYPPDVSANNDKSEQELETFSTSSSAPTTFAGFPFGDINDV